MDQESADAVARTAADTVSRLLDTPGLRRLTSLAQELQEGAPTGPAPHRPPPDERETPEPAAMPGRPDRPSSAHS